MTFDSSRQNARVSHAANKKPAKRRNKRAKARGVELRERVTFFTKAEYAVGAR